MKRLLALTACAVLTPAGTAHAEFTAPEIISATPGAQANDATSSVAVSSDGRYVAFRSRASNLYPDAPLAGQTREQGGIFRKDLVTGALELVVPGQVKVGGVVAGALTSGTQPSVSADGRFISFSTSLPLAPADTNSAHDVYRRDMTVPAGSADAYALVSAVDGGDAALTYGDVRGSLAVAHAISDDGRRVAFTVTAPSNVGSTASSAIRSPAGQIVVRDFQDRRTHLLSTTRAAPHAPVGEQLSGPFLWAPLPALSADGSTVAWVAKPDQQVALSNNQTAPQLIWKRIASDAQSEARLALGYSDPDDPACPANAGTTNQLEPGPCDGPLASTPLNEEAPITSFAMSRDGNTISAVGGPIRYERNIPQGKNLYVIDMTPGLSRKQATRALAIGADAQSTANVVATSIAPDASWIAYTTPQTIPLLTSPTPVGLFPPPRIVNKALLFGIDRSANTVQLLSRAYDGLGVDGNSLLPSVSDQGRSIAFLTDATNLFYGDANDKVDAAVIRRPAPVVPTSLVELPRPISPATEPIEARLTATAYALPSGTVRLRVTTPNDGRVTITTRRAALSRKAGRKPRTQPKVAPVLTRDAKQQSPFELDLAPLRKFKPEPRRRGGLRAVIEVAFTNAGGTRATQSIAVTFKRARVDAKKAER